MEIEDFIVKKINSLKEEQIIFSENEENDTEVDNQVFTFERLMSSETDDQNLASVSLKKVVLTTDDLRQIDTKNKNNNKLTNSLIKVAKLGLVTLTLATILFSLKVDNKVNNLSNRKVSEKILETINSDELTQDQDGISTQDVIDHVIEKSREKENIIEPSQENLPNLDSANIIEPSQENPVEIEDEDIVEPSKEKKQPKKSAKNKISISPETYEYVMKNEDVQLFSGKKLSSIPKWDNTQWSVGYGVCVYGYNAKRGIKSEKPWKDKEGNVIDWVDNLRKAYGNIPPGPGDRTPTKDDEGAIGEQTAKKAMIYFIIKNTSDGFKSYSDIWKHAPAKLKTVLVDLLHNMGVNTLNKFPKMTKNLKQVLDVYKNKKQNTPEGKIKIKKFMKKVVFELSRGNNSNEASDYFYDSHWKKVKDRLKKRKSSIKKYKNNIKKYKLKVKKYKNNPKNSKLLKKSLYNLNLNKDNLEKVMSQVNDTRVVRNISMLYEIAGIPAKEAISFAENLRLRITGKNGKKIEKETKNENILREYIHNLIT